MKYDLSLDMFRRFKPRNLSIFFFFQSTTILISNQLSKLVLQWSNKIVCNDMKFINEIFCNIKSADSKRIECTIEVIATTLILAFLAIFSRAFFWKEIVMIGQFIHSLHLIYLLWLRKCARYTCEKWILNSRKIP